MSLVELWKVLKRFGGCVEHEAWQRTTANKHMIHGFRQDPSSTCCGRGCGIGGGERWGGRF
jgi:hypothetical protein